MCGERRQCDLCRMQSRFGLALVASGLAGCATPQQYVYNCNPFAVTVDGRSIASRTFGPRGREGATKAIHPDGSAHAPLRVSSSQVDSFGVSNAWISPANVCGQFKTGVVIVDLR